MERTRISVPKKEQRPGTPKVNSQYRANYVTREGAQIMLKVYDMAVNAGLTWMELTDILTEEVHRRISKMTWRNGKRRPNLKGIQ
jgi:Mg2+ and Co2+ transporter CorA